jgi:hypothetical protein
MLQNYHKHFLQIFCICCQKNISTSISKHKTNHQSLARAEGSEKLKLYLHPQP